MGLGAVGWCLVRARLRRRKKRVGRERESEFAEEKRFGGESEGGSEWEEDLDLEMGGKEGEEEVEVEKERGGEGEMMNVEVQVVVSSFTLLSFFL